MKHIWKTLFACLLVLCLLTVSLISCTNVGTGEDTTVADRVTDAPTEAPTNAPTGEVPTAEVPTGEVPTEKPEDTEAPNYDIDDNWTDNY